MPDEIILYHNPRCSKSRQALALLNEKAGDFTVIEYLKDPLKANELTGLVKKLGLTPHQIVRTKEPEYAEAGLSPDSSDNELIAAIVKYPKLLERPIVVRGGKAAIGRPPENVLDVL